MVRPSRAIQPSAGLCLVVGNLDRVLASRLESPGLGPMDLLDVLNHVDGWRWLLTRLVGLAANFEPSTRGPGSEQSLASDARGPWHAGLKATPPNPRSGSTRGFHRPLHWQNLSGLANPPTALEAAVGGLGGLGGSKVGLLRLPINFGSTPLTEIELPSFQQCRYPKPNRQSEPHIQFNTATAHSMKKYASNEITLEFHRLSNWDTATLRGRT